MAKQDANINVEQVIIVSIKENTIELEKHEAENLRKQLNDVLGNNLTVTRQMDQ